MTIPAVLALVQDALWVALCVCAPLLVITSSVGLVISTLQAVTQINEPSLSFIPKILTSGTIILIGGSWMLKTLVDFAIRMLSGPAGT